LTKETSTALGGRCGSLTLFQLGDLVGHLEQLLDEISGHHCIVFVLFQCGEPQCALLL
jgi:hypothetical protein